MKLIAKTRNGERGASLLLVTLSLTGLLAMVGLAIDAGQLFVTKQNAQAAADAAAQAGVMDMYNGTGGNNGLSSARAYSQLNGFDPAVDTVTVTWPSCSSLSWCNGHVALDNSSPNLIQVTVGRLVPTKFLRVLGLSNSTVTATAYAGISYAPAAIPIVVTHPHLVDALQENGGTQITITGGPPRAIQVNSDGTISPNGHTASTPEAFSISNNSFVNLSQAGPSGTGADFRSWGPAATTDSVAQINTTTVSSSCSVWLCLGTTGHYVQPASLISDPFAALAQPTAAGLSAGTVTTINNNSGNTPISLGVSNCTAQCPPKSTCRVYGPGTYSSGVVVNNAIAYFKPGLYYIPSTDTNGFKGGSGSNMFMLSSVCSNTPNDAGTGSGMVVFNAGSGAFTVGANGSAVLTGPAISNTTYEGILFWQDRTRNPGAVVTNLFGGGGQLQLTGTIYANMNTSNVTNSNYQQVSLKGNSGSTTQIIGEIITNVLFLTGGGTINMQLSSTQVKNVRAVAFVE